MTSKRLDVPCQTDCHKIQIYKRLCQRSFESAESYSRTSEDRTDPRSVIRNRGDGVAEDLASVDAPSLPSIIEAQLTVVIDALSPSRDDPCAEVDAHPPIAEPIEPVPLGGEGGFLFDQAAEDRFELPQDRREEPRQDGSIEGPGMDRGQR